MHEIVFVKFVFRKEAKQGKPFRFAADYSSSVNMSAFQQQPSNTEKIVDDIAEKILICEVCVAIADFS